MPEKCRVAGALKKLDDFIGHVARPLPRVGALGSAKPGCV